MKVLTYFCQHYKEGSFGPVYELDFNASHDPSIFPGEGVTRAKALEFVNDWNSRSKTLKYWIAP